MNPRKRYMALVFGAILMIMGAQISYGAPDAPPDYDAKKMARLQDNVMEYEELGDLVKEYNPTVQGQVLNAYNNSIQQLQDMEDTFKRNASQYDRWMKDLRDEHGFSQAEADEVLRLSQGVSKGQVTETQLGSAMMNAGIDSATWSSYTTYLTVKMTFQGIANAYHDAIEQNTRVTTTAQMDEAISRITAGTQQLMNQYNQLLSQRELVQKNKELNRALYELKINQRKAGLTTEAEVLAAQKDELTADSSLMQVENGISNIRQTLCMMTGWSWDAQPEIGKIPNSDLGAMAGMNPESDVERAVNNNYTVRSTRHTKSGEGNSQRNNHIRTVDETEQKAAAKLKDLYAAVLEKKLAYESAKTAYQAAELERGKADRQKQAGLISDVQYLGLEVSYLQKKSAMDCADMALYQALETYNWAVAGVADFG